MSIFRLGINVDHVATLRQARRVSYPDPLEAALEAECGGAGGITIHLREDRRHIQDDDVLRMRNGIATKLNLELAWSTEIVKFAITVRPPDVCIVPERREELTTEGGLAVAANLDHARSTTAKLASAGIRVSLFIDPDEAEIRASAKAGAPVIEIHTGTYADAGNQKARQAELARIQAAVRLANELGLSVNAGHGLTLENVAPIASIREIEELNIGHSIVSRAVLVGIREATREMLDTCLAARQ